MNAGQEQLTAQTKFALLLERLEFAFSNHSDKSAIGLSENSITYDQLAFWIQKTVVEIQSKTPTQNVRVVVFSDKPFEYIPAMLACFSMGALYVPMDPKAPKERLQQMLEEVSPSVLLLGTLTEDLDLQKFHSRVYLPKFTGENISSQYPVFTTKLDEEQPAYLFYTSGSTGMPKGIVGKLSSLNHFVEWESDTFSLDNSSRISQLTTPTFDAFLRDVLTPLSIGATVCIPPQKPTEMGSDALWDWLEKQGVSLIHCVPSLFSALLSGEWLDRPLPALRHILMAGEALPLHHAKSWIQHFGDRIPLINLYGSTETTMVKMFHRIQYSDINNGFIPIGSPMPETEVFILDERGSSSAPGELGEIYIATEHRTLGYFQQKEATEKVFKTIPQTGTLAYATGDLGSFLPDGTVRLAGRKDRQLKIGGVRIEPEEIERALLKDPLIQACAVLSVDNESETGNLIAKEKVQNILRNNQPETRLIAYLVLNQETTLRAIRNKLADRLPAPAIPRSFFRLKQLPLNPNGKNDYAALQSLEEVIAIGNHNYLAPVTDNQKQIAEIWGSILGTQSISLNDNFFELGGDSLKAMQVANRIRDNLKCPIKITALLRNPELLEFCKVVEERLLQNEHAQNYKWIETTDQTVTHFPLTPAQKGLWFLWKMEPESAYYTCQGIIHFKGRFDLEAFQEAWRELQTRHDMLRVRFGNHEGKPVQWFEESTGALPEFIDLEHLSVEGGIESIRNHAKSDAKMAFNLEKDPLLRTVVYRLREDHHALQLTMHEITVDLWAIRIMMNDLAKLYQQAIEGKTAKLPNVGPSLKQYLLWQDNALKTSRQTQSESYWKESLEGELPILGLPLDRPRPSTPSYAGKTVFKLLDENLTTRLKDLSNQSGNTLYVTLLSGFYWMLYRYTGQSDIIIGSPLAQRDQAECENLFGFFLNMLPLRCKIETATTAGQFLNTVSETVNLALEASDYSFTNILEWAKSTRDTSMSPVFQVMFNMLSFADPKLDFEEFSLAYESLETGHTKYDFSLYAQEYGDQLFLQIAYQTELFDETTMQRFLDNLETFYDSLTKALDVPLSQIEYLHPKERTLLLEVARGPEKPLPKHTSLTGLFDEQVNKAPASTALIFEDRSMSYRELDCLVNQLAIKLLNQGVSPDEPIAVSLERLFSMVAAILAVLKVGAPHLYLDPDYPTARNQSILDKVKPQILISDPGSAIIANHCPTIIWSAVERINLDAHSIDLSNASPQGKLFSIVYTSASSGDPKGVKLTQDSLLNRFQWMWDAYPFSDDDTMLFQKSLSLVASAWECLGGLLAGVPTVITTRDNVLDPVAFVNLCNKNKVTRIYGSPALLSGIIDQKERQSSNFSELRLAFTSAEPISPAQVQRWRTCFPDTPLHNLYGSTECSSNAMEYDCGQLSQLEQRVPLGKPLPNIQTYVMDKDLQLAPKGAIGELCVSGACLADGYLDSPSQTSLSFTKLSISELESRPLYRTGDLVRLRQDDNMEYLGRNDFQIKVRGFRIEPAEIENALLTNPSIKECVVTVWSPEYSPDVLIAYYLSSDTDTEANLRRFLRNLLPDYMIPTHLIQLEEMPRTTHGKIDRSKLPEPARQSYGTAIISPSKSNSLESNLLRLWQQLLGKPEICRDDNFFDLGGHSLMAAKLFSEIEKLTGTPFPVSTLYRAPTIGSLVEILQEQGLRKTWNTLVPMRESGTKPPLFCITPWNGSAFYFRCMPKYLDPDQPIYGLEPINEVNKADPFGSIEAMIQQFFSDIQSFYPEGPLHLSGFSGGGVVAWELARLLTDAGRTVESLFMFDTSRPGFKRESETLSKQKSSPMEKIGSYRKAVQRQNGINKAGYLIDTLALKIKWHLQDRGFLKRPDSSVEQELMETKRKYFNEYSVSPYNGKVVLFRARDRRIETMKNPYLGWLDFSEQEIEICEVPGGHNTMLLDPNAVTLCKKLQKHLATNTSFRAESPKV